MLLAPGSAVGPATPEAGGVPAGLAYSSDAEPGITRVPCGNGSFGLTTLRNRHERIQGGAGRTAEERRMVAFLRTLR